MGTYGWYIIQLWNQKSELWLISHIVWSPVISHHFWFRVTDSRECTFVDHQRIRGTVIGIWSMDREKIDLIWFRSFGVKFARRFVLPYFSDWCIRFSQFSGTCQKHPHSWDHERKRISHLSREKRSLLYAAILSDVRFFASFMIARGNNAPWTYRKVGWVICFLCFCVCTGAFQNTPSYLQASGGQMTLADCPAVSFRFVYLHK